MFAPTNNWKSPSAKFLKCYTFSTSQPASHVPVCTPQHILRARTVQCATNLCLKKWRQLLPIIMLDGPATAIDCRHALLHGPAIRQTLLYGHFPRSLRRPQATPSTDHMYPSAVSCISYVLLHAQLFLPHSATSIQFWCASSPLC